MYPVFLRMADGPATEAGASGGQGQAVGGMPELIKVDVEPGDAAVNKVVVRAEVDGLGRRPGLVLREIRLNIVEKPPLSVDDEAKRASRVAQRKPRQPRHEALRHDTRCRRFRQRGVLPA